MLKDLVVRSYFPKYRSIDFCFSLLGIFTLPRCKEKLFVQDICTKFPFSLFPPVESPLWVVLKPCRHTDFVRGNLWCGPRRLPPPPKSLRLLIQCSLFFCVGGFLCPSWTMTHPPASQVAIPHPFLPLFFSPHQ